MLLSADEDFLEEDMYGELGRAITETDAYTVAKELIQESIVQKKVKATKTQQEEP